MTLCKHININAFKRDKKDKVLDEVLNAWYTNSIGEPKKFALFSIMFIIT